jgi:hypothetical protein
MKSYSILSPNRADLLIRMHDELVKGGMKSDVEWNMRCNPNTDIQLAKKHRRLVYNYCLHTGSPSGLGYYNNDCLFITSYRVELIHLTPENFDEVLKKVIENS